MAEFVSDSTKSEARELLAKAYADNGDLGAARYIRGGFDLYPDTGIALLAICDALATRAAPPAMDREAVDFLHQLRRVNTDRYHAWVGDGQDAGILFDAAELGGEVGELLNVVKKLEREERGWRGSRAAPQDFADECADVLICLDKLARRRGVDLEAATVAKFNATSDKVGLPHKLSTLSADAIRQGEGATTANSSVVPDGWKLVPIEPTPEMRQAAIDELSGPTDFSPKASAWDAIRAYRAMLAATPRLSRQRWGRGMSKAPSKACIVCGRRVPRRMDYVEVSPPSNPNGSSHRARVSEDLRSLADCRRHTNLPFVISAQRDGQGFIRAFNAWDGESYMFQGFFCTNRCAQDQGYASAQHGHRYTWKRGAA